MEQIRVVGAKKVVAVCTDGAANMKKARELVVAEPDCSHIFNLRCAMHCYSLFLGDMMSSQWARGIIERAQRLVTHIRASHLPQARLHDLAKPRPGTLKTSNKTRFTSVYEMLKSVLDVEMPLKQVKLYVTACSLFSATSVSWSLSFSSCSSCLAAS